MTLREAVADPDRKAELVADAMVALHDEVHDLGGFTGRLIRAGYDAVARLRPNFIESNVEHMLGSFVDVIDPHLASARSGPGVEKYFSDNADDIADDLLQITDDRADRARNAVAKSIYSKMRGVAKKYVVNASPRLGLLADKHG